MSWSIAIMVIAIVFISAVAKIQREKWRAIGRSNGEAQPAEAIASREEVRALKERIAVLERVITDNHTGSADLSRQIDALRER